MSMALDFTRRKKQRKLEIADLCEDLLENILARVSLKPRTRLKCVSKSWCKSITNLRYSNPPTTSSGLVLCYDGSDSPSAEFTTTLFTVQDQGKECILQSSLKVDLIKPLLKVSFRGLLLYQERRNFPYYTTTSFYVSSPLLNQYVALPPIMERPCFVGLFHHQSRKRDQFNVICFRLPVPDYFDGTINCRILSSDTLEWRDHRAPVYNVSLYNGSCHITCHPGIPNTKFNCVYNHGKLYWLICNARGPLMLVYNIDGDFFKLVVLPATWQCGRFDLLYESHDCLYYCELSKTDLILWAFLDDGGDGNGYDDDDYKNNKDGQLRWRITHSMAKCKLIEQIEETYGTEYAVHFHGHGTPVAFNEELLILFLIDEFIVWAYSIETRRITKVWSSPYPYLRYSLHRFGIQSFDLNPVPTLEYLNNHAS